LQIRITAPLDDTPVTLPEPLGFGRVFSPRMLVRHWSAESGWDPSATIGPRAPIALDPGAQVLHCGQAIFEGTKAYRRPDGTLGLFRPDANAARFNRSARRLALPTLPEDDFVAALEALAHVERAWAPHAEGASLYLRPVLMGIESTLEVRASRRCLFYVIASPTGPYFASGFEPVGVRIETDHVRAARGGTGSAKTIGNYAGSLAATEGARGDGWQQVLWLDAAERRWIEEAGAMNVAFVRDGREIVTPALSGSILEGITRDSVLRMAPDLGFPVREARLDLEAVLAEIRDGRITEAFCMGTAAVIVPIGRFGHAGTEIRVGDGRAGPVATRLYRALTDLQYGRAQDPYGWTRSVGSTTAPADAAIA
jgi:branched-chain amino acid aminotransferase